MKKSLLLKISDTQNYKSDIENIKQIYRPSGPIFVLRERFGQEDEVELYITFNTEYHFKYNGVIKVNKKSTTIYTIDALNILAIEELGKIDKSFVPDWNEFENCILLSSKEEGKVNIIPTKVFEVIN